MESVALLVSSADSAPYHASAGSTLHLRQGEQTTVQCELRRVGTLEPPNMAVEVGGQSEFGKFVREDFPTVTQMPGAGWAEAITVSVEDRGSRL